jgi:hypothetical protein
MNEKELLRIICNSFSNVKHLNVGDISLVERLLSVQNITDELVELGYSDLLVKWGSCNLQRKKKNIKLYRETKELIKMLDL